MPDYNPDALSETIYEGVREQYMAHTILATENYICEKRKAAKKGANFHICAKAFNGVLAKKKKGATITLMDDSSAAMILYDSSLTKDARRLAIAHELGHLLFGATDETFSSFHLNKSGIECLCNDFMKSICIKHNEFQKSPENKSYREFQEDINDHRHSI